LLLVGHLASSSSFGFLCRSLLSAAAAAIVAAADWDLLKTCRCG